MIYFWSLKELTHELRIRSKSLLNTAAYAAGLGLLIQSGCTAPIILTRLYYITFTALKGYLESQVAPLKFTLHVYDLPHFDKPLLIASAIAIMVVFITRCAVTKQIRASLYRTVSFLFVINIRAIAGLITFFGVSTVVGLGRALYHLRQLNQTTASTFFKHIGRLIQEIDHFYIIRDSIHDLYQAELFFAKINELSKFLAFSIPIVASAVTLISVFNLLWHLGRK